MGKIRELPPETANKIAAGEVVERPASVVKELVENAIDAEATHIEIELEEAGKELIRVRDNGIGMPADDLLLCYHPHATSKLQDATDLFDIRTMGFRGEALASIGSISESSVCSCAKGEEQGYQVDNHAGEIQGPKPVSCSQGTTVEVRNLFFNTPVRRRFLKRNATELTRIIESVQRIGLAYPEVGFTLIHKGRKVINAPSTQSSYDRILQFFGKDLVGKLIEVNDLDDYSSLNGFITNIEHHKSNSKDIYLYVNQRFVRDRSLLHAITLAYREFIPPGRYPQTYLFLDLSPEEVDVNVHPTKIEVRFVEPNRLFRKLKAAVREALLRSGELPALPLNRSAGAQEGGSRQAEIHRAMSDFIQKNSQQEETSAQGMFKNRTPLSQSDAARRNMPEAAQSKPGASILSQEQYRQARPLKAKFELSKATTSDEEVSQKSFENQGTGQDVSIVQGNESQGGQGASSISHLLGNARGAFQLGAMFIVIELEDSIAIIDQHAYHERILYWQLEHRLELEPPEVQRLLVPEPLELSQIANHLLHDYLEVFQSFGFQIEAFGNDNWALYALPRYIKTSRVKEFVEESLEALAEDGNVRSLPELRKSMVEMIACRAAIKAGDVLGQEEIKALLEEGTKVPHTFSCPHGRPTTFKLHFTELEKFFHRR